MIRLLLLERDTQLRASLTALLEHDPEVVVVAAIDEVGALRRSLATTSADVLFVSSGVSSLEAIDACDQLQLARPRTRCVVALANHREATLLSALAAGARAAVLTDSPAKVLREAVRTVADGLFYLDPRLTGSVISSATRSHQRLGVGGLTAQELRVVQRVVAGLDDHQIADQLRIRPATVSGHVRSAARKLGAEGRAEVGSHARRAGLV